MQPGLYLVATPIGNLADLSSRALEILREATLILAEDTRHTRKLLSRYDIHTPLQSSHAHNEARQTDALVRRIRDGAAVALVTDSGMPCISDPGARTVAACRAAGLPVWGVPGPSAVTLGLALSGFPADRFVFEGFLPVKSGGRARRIETWREEERTVVFFESPHRLLRLLGELHEMLPDRLVFVGRELTKHYEEHLLGHPAELLAAFEGRAVKGECVVLIAPCSFQFKDNAPRP